VPAFFNGMATGADWMSAASFMGLAGTLYLSGISGAGLHHRLDRRLRAGGAAAGALSAAFRAIHDSRLSRVPAMAATRMRLVAVFAAILASFVYVVAQIYGVGVITSRFVSLQFEIGVFVGLAGILVCSFLGGMRAVTWTQVAQYVDPDRRLSGRRSAILSYKVTGMPVPQVVYGQVLQKVTAFWQTNCSRTPAETEVRKLYRERGRPLRRKDHACLPVFARCRARPACLRPRSMQA
jgi:cation/acetate symporter